MSNNESAGPGITPEVRREIVKWIVQAVFGLIGYGLILFLAAGRLDWIWGWVQLIILAGFLAAHPLLVGFDVGRDPGLDHGRAVHRADLSGR